MDWKKRIFRRPAVTTAWIAVLTAMSMLLGVGANLLHSADSLLETIDQHHTTIGVQTIEAGLTAMGNYQNLSVTLSKYELEELRALDSVEMVDLRTLTGAYIPELMGQVALMDWGTFCKTDVDIRNAETKTNDSYNEVVFVGTVVDTVVTDMGYVNEPPPIDCTEIGGSEMMYDMQCYAVVQIDEIISAHPDYEFYPSDMYTSYTGKVAMEINYYDLTPNAEEAVNPLEIGQQYIFTGAYRPMTSARSYGYFSWPRNEGEAYPWVSVGGRYTVPGAIITTSWCINQGDDWVIYKADEDMTPWEQRGLPVAMYCRDEMPYAAFSKFEGTVEEFLAENELWADTVAMYERQLRSFPIIGTEALETMYVFHQNEASLTSGRTFTQEEYDSGAKVCVISETVAMESGIQVGDTIHLSQYINGRSAEEGNTSLHTEGAVGSLNNPSAGRFPAREYVTENEEFTVVGIYQLQSSWDSSSFSITPNAVFIPQKAQIPGGFGGASYALFGGSNYNQGYGTSYANGSYGIYFSVKIKNGMMDEFLTQAAEIVPNRFHVFDQGYSAAVESVKAVQAEAWKLIGIASVGWLLLLALYLLLYQNREKQNLGIMRSLGARPEVCRNYLFTSGFLLASVGIVLGTLLSSAATRLVSDELAEFMLSAESMLALSGGQELGSEVMADILSRSELPMQTMLLLTAAQLALIALALYLHAAKNAKRIPRDLMAG